MEEKKSAPVIRKRVIAGALAMGTLLGAGGVANALISDDTAQPSTAEQTTDDGTTTTDDTEAADPVEGEDDDAGVGEVAESDNDDGGDENAGEQHGSDEIELTGTEAEQVTAAALEAVPGGTVDRVETDDHGAAFEAHMTDADGNRVTVKFDASYAVIEVEQGR